MQATIIDTGGLPPQDFFNYAINNFVDNRVMEYLQQNFQQFYNTIQDTGSQIINMAKQAYDYFTNNEIINKAKNILRNGSVLIKDDMIQCLRPSMIPDAGMVMREYIISQPKIFNMYINNRCDGWGDIVNIDERDLPPIWRDNYMQATDGMVMFNKNGNGYVRHSVVMGKEKLDIIERSCILDAWDDALIYIANGIDPTDPNKGQL